MTGLCRFRSGLRLRLRALRLGRAQLEKFQSFVAMLALIRITSTTGTVDNLVSLDWLSCHVYVYRYGQLI